MKVSRGPIQGCSLEILRAGSCPGVTSRAERTDGGGVGAISAIQSGVFQMSKSGGSKRVLSAISKLQRAYA